MKYNLVLLIAFIVTGSVLKAQPAPEAWKADWIVPEGLAPTAYSVAHYRKQVELPGKPASFPVRISGDTHYKLYVNGKLAASGPARSDFYHWYYDSVDLAPLLQAGRNQLAALVWNFGDQRPEAQISHRTGFVLEGKDAASIVNTGKTWKATENKAYHPLQPQLVYSYYVAGPGEQVNYQEFPLGWTQAAYDDSQWKEAASLGHAVDKGAFSWIYGWMLVPSPLPAMERKKTPIGTVREGEKDLDAGALVSGRGTLTVPANRQVRFLIDHGVHSNGYPVLGWSGGRSAEISLQYAEALYVKDGPEEKWREQTRKGNRNETAGKRMVGVKDVLIAGGRTGESFESLSWRTFRYLLLEIKTGPEPLVIDSFYHVFTGYPLVNHAQFESGDTLHRQILETGWRTARACAVETYMDCPYYEQLQYAGDTRIQALVTLYNSHDDRLVRNALQQLDWSRMAEGLTLSRYPTAHAQQIPPFSLWWIGMLHDYYYYRNDTAFLKSLLPGSRQVLSFFRSYQQADGRVKNLPYWVFTDWTVAKDWSGGKAPTGKDGCSAVIDLQLCWAYQQAAELEAALGYRELAAGYRADAEKLKRSIRSAYWDPVKKAYADRTEKDLYSQHANALAILSGMNNRKDDAALAAHLMQDTSLAPATVYYLYYVNQALAKAGEGNRYLDRLDIWKKNLDMGMTTWAEMSNIDGSRSDCHAWGSSPNIEFYRIVLGVDSDGPGFRRIRIEPHIGSLRKLSGAVPHPNGEVQVQYALDAGNALQAELELPAGTSGTFVWKGKQYPLKAGPNKLRL